jgi:sulfide dehydrogenase cytochrome subunit
MRPIDCSLYPLVPAKAGTQASQRKILDSRWSLPPTAIGGGNERRGSFRTVHALAVAILCTSASAASAVDVPPAGAAACSGCHPASRAVETQFTRLNGRNVTEIVTAMQEFRAGQRPGTVMDRIAKGFTDDEIKAIAAWFAAQKE